MKKCKAGPSAACGYVTNKGYCTLPEDESCINQEECVFGVNKCSEAETVAVGRNVVIGPDDVNKIKINCDEITLTKDSVGIEVNIQNLIQNIDKFETIEINERVFKRVRKEEV